MSFTENCVPWVTIRKCIQPQRGCGKGRAREMQEHGAMNPPSRRSAAGSRDPGKLLGKSRDTRANSRLLSGGNSSRQIQQELGKRKPPQRVRSTTIHPSEELQHSKSALHHQKYTLHHRYFMQINHDAASNCLSADPISLGAASISLRADHINHDAAQIFHCAARLKHRAA